ncbi:MAG: carboxy terminal-processing peptidase [Pirellulaceae bacterium]|nr:carboxy terminal-processing peptidase [Pirellulaceae bacterium]
MANRLPLISLVTKPGCPRVNRLQRQQKLLQFIVVGLIVAIAVPNLYAQPAAAPAQAVAAAPVALPKPTNEHRTIARLIARLMPQHHISSQGLNDTISERALTLYLKSLDPMKLYFYQSDVDEFQRSSKMIDDMVQQGDLSLAYKIFGRFIQRVDERVGVALNLLGSDFDFSKDEQIVIDPDAATYATTPAEADDRWRRQIKYALLDLKDEGKEGDEALNQLRRRYNRYAKRWRGTDNNDILEMYLTAVTTGYDPHSTYMSPRTLKEFTMSMGLSLDGIGAQLREKDGSTIITRVIPGGAAAKHGKLKTDDVIVSVGQADEGPMTDIVEMPLTKVVDQIRGRAGTTVRLGVKPGGVGDVKIYKIVRARIELSESAARGKVIDHVNPETGAEMKIGYINLPSFYLDMNAAKLGAGNFRSSTRDVRKILMDFQNQGVEGIVLDLSKNGGGSLTEAINLTGLFIDSGPVVQVKNSDGSVQKYDDSEAGTTWNGPLVVMTSKFSASASEIFAGAIQDYGRGIVVGDPATHGKGSVQTLMDLAQQIRLNRANFGALKVTLQQFYLPDGESTQLKGVNADVLLPSVTSKMDISESDLKFALQHDTVPAAGHEQYSMVPRDLLQSIRERSASRVSKDEEFDELRERIDLYVAQKELEKVSVNEEKFMARREELNAQKEEEEKELEQQLGNEVVYRDTFYNTEVLNITQDYVEGLRKQNLAQAR